MAKVKVMMKTLEADMKALEARIKALEEMAEVNVWRSRACAKALVLKVLVLMALALKALVRIGVILHSSIVH